MNTKDHAVSTERALDLALEALELLTDTEQRTLRKEKNNG
jgi:hypothetical protein